MSIKTNWPVYGSLALTVLMALLLGAMEWGALQQQVRELAKTVDELRQEARYVHGEIHVPKEATK